MNVASHAYASEEMITLKKISRALEPYWAALNEAIIH